MKSKLHNIIGPILFLAIWEIAVLLWDPLPVILPSPVVVLKSALRVLVDSVLWSDIYISLYRVLIGYVLGSVLGIFVGAGMSRSKTLEALIGPSLVGLRFVIPFAWIPIVALWFGLSEGGKIFITMYATFFVVAFQTEEGFKSVDVMLLKAARTLGATKRQLLFKVSLPAAMPAIFTGLRLGLALAWIAVLAAELVTSSSGIGYYVLNQADLFNTPAVLFGMMLIGLIGFILDLAFKILENGLLSRYMKG